MPKLLQINITANWGSTGKIAEQIGLCAMAHGWESYVAYGRWANPSESKLIHVGGVFNTYEHYAENRFLDNEGLASRIATRKFLRELDKIKPDVVHLHNIHDHYMNYPLLFKYLADRNIPVVWTQHDLWAMTGHCPYNMIGCRKWESECKDCPLIPKFCIDRSTRNHRLKKDAFTSVKNMTIVPVSEWLGTEVQKSFLNDYPMKVIKNGVDVNVFRPMDGDVRNKYGLNGKHILLAVSSVWPESKGLSDYVRLSEMLPDEFRIVLVGLTQEQIASLPESITRIARTDSQMELAQMYSAADVVMSLSASETFGLTLAEGMACGSPVVVYNNTAQPELVTPDTGRVVENGNVEQLRDVLIELVRSDFKRLHTNDCRKRAEEIFDKNKAWESYISLYAKILNGGGIL